MMLPTISLRSLFTGKMNSLLTDLTSYIRTCTLFKDMLAHRDPFLTSSDAAHTMQLIKDRLETRQYRPIKQYREGPLQPRLMLRLS
jgi:hypothetical protein